MATTKKIGLVFCFDFLKIYGGSIQRIKADLAALTSLGYTIQAVFPTGTEKALLKQKAGEYQAVLRTYPNVQGVPLLSQKTRLLLSQYGQMINPFFYLAFQPFFKDVQIIFAHCPTSFVSAYLASGGKKITVYVAHNCEYTLMKQTTRNPLVHKIVYLVEKYACSHAARVLCVSEQDRLNLQKTYHLPPGKAVVFPNTVDVAHFDRTAALFDKTQERQELGIDAAAFILIFTGRMDYRPNSEALQFILKKLAPALEDSRRPFRLLVAGTQIPPWCLKNENPKISYYSDVPDMRRFFAVADAAIVPLASAGGTRIKILEAFAARIPVISTDKGCEGIDCRDGRHLLVAGMSAADFIEKATALMENPGMRDSLVNNAYQLVTHQYSTAAAGEHYKQLIAELEKPDIDGPV